MFRLVDMDAIPDARLAQYAAWLGPDEVARHARFVRPRRGRQFVAGRGLLRQMLGELLGIAPDHVVLNERPGMAPRVAGSPGVGLSISHSGCWVACAVDAHRMLGLDIEVMAPGRDFLALAAQAFEPVHCAELEKVPADHLAQAFYRMWTTHEAGIKLGEHVATTVHIPHPALSITLCGGASG